jgi:uncharacterized membrane protein YoaK (UPF0700 family)
MEWILILVAITLIFFVSQFLQKWLAPKIKPEVRLLFSLCWFLILMTMLLIHDVGRNNFTLFQQIVLIAFSIGYLTSFYFRYKKIKHSTINR